MEFVARHPFVLGIPFETHVELYGLIPTFALLPLNQSLQLASDVDEDGIVLPQDDTAELSSVVQDDAVQPSGSSQTAVRQLSGSDIPPTCTRLERQRQVCRLHVRSKLRLLGRRRLLGF